MQRVGVAPTISALRFPEELPATSLWSSFAIKNQLKQLASIDSDMAEVVRTAGFWKAAETIKTVNAQYGYKPEHSRLRLQVGAVIAFLNSN